MIEMIKTLPRSVCNALVFLAGVFVWHTVDMFVSATKDDYRTLHTSIGKAIIQIDDTNQRTAKSLSEIHRDITALQLDLVKLRAEMLTPTQVELMIKTEIGKYHRIINGTIELPSHK